ncbi:MAG: zinc-ribbon domain-containing protein [Proteobacteria bacterium]|nr:zinc-ribbon domain-containing protein [Pseudomonadota bacterium]
MKIVCDSCGAKYSIADEKVAGKIFRIRCKRCSEVLTIRGDQPAEAAAVQQPPIAAPPPDAIWHIVIAGEQQGPYTHTQLAELLAAHTIDWDAYVWRDGLDDWVPARDSAELVSLVTGQAPPSAASSAAASAQPEPAAAPAEQDDFAAEPPSMGADPFAGDASSPFGDAAAAESSPFGQVAAAGPGADLFASPAAAGPLARASQPQAAGPRVTAEQAMTGARNENSVLFSLGNLQALATGAGSAAPSDAASAPPSEDAGFAQGEASGLIDIRALAQAAGSGTDGPNGQSPQVDDLLMGSGGGGFGALGSPMSAGQVPEGEGTSKTLIVAILGGFAILAAAVVGGMMLLKEEAPAARSVLPSSPPPSAHRSDSKPTTGAASEQTAASPAAASPTAKPTQAEPPGAAAPEPEPVARKPQPKPSQQAGSHERRSARRRDTRSSRKARSSRQERPKKVAPEPKPKQRRASRTRPVQKAAAKPKKKAASGSIDDLLEQAVGGVPDPLTTKRKPVKVKTESNLPETPSRDQVMKALRAVQRSVKNCSKSEHGVAMTTITVSGSNGRVRSAKVSGDYAGTRAGSCIARAVRKARFPKFKKPEFKIQFPFRL